MAALGCGGPYLTLAGATGLGMTIFEDETDSGGTERQPFGRSGFSAGDNYCSVLSGFPIDLLPAHPIDPAVHSSKSLSATACFRVTPGPLAESQQTQERAAEWARSADPMKQVRNLVPSDSAFR